MADSCHTDDHFLRLFSRRILEALPKGELLDRLVIVESAAGGGKTSLLRLLTPGPLMRVHAQRSSVDYKELAALLLELKILADSGPGILGVLISCRQSYSMISELNLSAEERDRWFMTLLDSRTTLLMLRSALQLAGGQYPHDVQYLELKGLAGQPQDLESISGEALYKLASAREQAILRSIDTLAPQNTFPSELLTSRLDVAGSMARRQLFFRGREVAARPLLMFDDVHLLERRQRRVLREVLQERDVSVGRWMARRLQALESEELLTETPSQGREWTTVRIESWRAKHGTAFERWLFDVGDRRSKDSKQSLTSFSSWLNSAMETPAELQRAELAVEANEVAARKTAGPHGGLFANWLDAAERLEGGAELRAENWARVRILMERRLDRRQLPLGAQFETLDMADTSDVGAAARLFAARAGGLPYYFGPAAIAGLASNVDQFLVAAGALFEALLSAGSKSRSEGRRLTATQQDTTIRKVSRAYLAGLRTTVPFGEDVHRLVTYAGEEAREQTYRITAPYLATGIALNKRDIARLQRDDGGSTFTRLRRALDSAIAHNVFEPRDSRSKGEDWLVLYLNRLLCPAFELSTQYGGYLPRKLSEVDLVVQDMASRALL